MAGPKRCGISSNRKLRTIPARAAPRRGNLYWPPSQYGIFLCLNCGIKHEALGFHNSFLRSLSVRSWSEIEIKKMEVGGNENLNAFFSSEEFLRRPTSSTSTAPRLPQLTATGSRLWPKGGRGMIRIFSHPVLTKCKQEAACVVTYKQSDKKEAFDADMIDMQYQSWQMSELIDRQAKKLTSALQFNGIAIGKKAKASDEADEFDDV